MSPRRVIIVGGGFGGVTLARRLERVAPAGAEVVLISGENHFVFTPLLPEAAGREILPPHVVIPGRQMVRRAQWLTADVTGIDRKSNSVRYVSRGGECGELIPALTSSSDALRGTNKCWTSGRRLTISEHGC